MIRMSCIFLVALAITACGGKAPTDAAATAPAPATAPAGHELAALLIDAPSGEVSPISVLKQNPQAGQAVVLSGRIGGRAQPFIPGRAAMILVDDRTLAACDVNPADNCATPWDFCCESQADLAKNMATVQVVGSDGKPRPIDLQGLGGIGPGSRVIVSGTVAEGSADGNLIVNATGIHAEGAPAPAAAGGAGHGH